MGVQYTRSGGHGDLFGSEYFNMAKNLQEIIEEELEDAGADGLLEAQETVENAGTGNTWPSPFRDRDGTVRSGPGQGRINTGKMISALDYRTYRGQGVGLDVGWIRIWEEYFGAQDEGTDATGYRNGGRAIEGMGVIAHLRTYMRDRVDEAMDRAIERINDGL